MVRNIASWTAPGCTYPAYVSINEKDDGQVGIAIRPPVGPDGKSLATVEVIMPRVDFEAMIISAKFWMTH